KFFDVIGHDLADSSLQSEVDFSPGLVVSVQVAIGSGDAGGKGGTEFAFAGRVDEASVLMRNFEDCEGAVGFAGKGKTRARGRRIPSGSVPFDLDSEVAFVVGVKRRAKIADQSADRFIGGNPPGVFYRLGH